MGYVGEGGDLPQKQDRAAHRLPTDQRIRHKAHEASLRDRTQKESGASDRLVPRSRGVVRDMLRIAYCNEDVNIRQISSLRQNPPPEPSAPFPW